jgi:hypothetical protein
LLISRELQWSSACFAANWDKNYTGVASGAVSGTSFIQWSDQTSSNPEADVQAAKTYILKATGYEANTLTVGYETFAALKQHPDIKDQYKYTSSESITEDMIAKTLGVEKLLVGKASYDTSDEPAAASSSFINGKGALLAYVPASPGLMVPSAMYTFVWANYTSLNTDGIAIKKFRIDPIASDRIEGAYAIDTKIVCSDLACYFATAVA